MWLASCPDSFILGERAQILIRLMVGPKAVLESVEKIRSLAIA
jgi:hypothetical protein